MNMLYAFVSVMVVSLIAFVGLFTLTLGERLLRRTLFLLVSLSVGALFGDAFIHLIPEAFETVTNPTLVSLSILAGIGLFFVLEKFLHWHHNHGADVDEVVHGHEHDHSKIKPVGYLVLVSDGFHNFIDGLIIGASYMVSMEVGIATTIAVMLHEIPQEVGDFGVLLHAGFSKMKALFYNFLSACAAILGVLATVFIGEVSDQVSHLITAFAAGGFIYIAGSDLVPELQKTAGTKKSVLQFIAIGLGIALMYGLLFFE
jgi:zinc and cadmium transporter